MMMDRAFVVLGDYLYQLETGDRQRGVTHGVQRTVAIKEKTPDLVRPISQFDQDTICAADTWEKEKLQQWNQQGRITSDGVLRVGHYGPKPYTLAEIIRIMPHLQEFDRLAVLIDLDGVVEEGFMEAHENIKSVVTTIAAEEIEKLLQTPQAQERIAAIVDDRIAAIFGDLLKTWRQEPVSALRRPGTRLQRCSKCSIPGHRANTCPKTPGEAAASKVELLKKSKEFAQ